ncbi:MAG: hypothetical protein VKI63_01475 [Cyanobium sp.]|nr:hypothetical protein [Cyanobium sp.]
MIHCRKWKSRLDLENLHRETYLGEACQFSAHEATLYEGKSFRYADSHACVECVRELMQPGLSIDVNRLRPERYHDYLRFWSHVDIRGPDECWPWALPVEPHKGDFRIRRPWDRKPIFCSIGRATLWNSWGDLGLLPYERLCDTRLCCNPLHLRITAVPHYIFRRQIDHIQLVRSALEVQRHRRSYIQTLGDPHSGLKPHHNRIWHQRVAAALGLNGESHRET